tara:strand:- start:23 stop:1012 length:990 start_codon:yes stop_codon:yes gene_type:complete
MSWNVRLEVGNYCNLRCPLCVRENVHKSTINSIHLSLKDTQKFLPRFFLHAEVDRVYLSGAVAEPTLNPEFIDIVKYLNKYSTVVIDSNGSTRDTQWWAELGATGVNCDFAPDSIKPNNNKYRINSNTDRVIDNMRAFISAGGVAEWKFIPYAHNEDEIDDHRAIASSIGAKFTFIQPRNADRLDNVDNSSAFSKGKIVNQHSDHGTPHNYCKLFGDVKGLIEISPEGIVYPCCMMPRQFYKVYENYFISRDTTPNLSHDDIPKYQSFIDTVVPLIEQSGGIESLSLYKHPIRNILKNEFYTGLQKAWDDKSHFCNNHCHHIQYKLSVE